MILDAKAQFIKTGGGENIGFGDTTDYIDLQAAGYFDAGTRPIYLNLQAITAFTGNPTVTLQTDSVVGFGSATTVLAKSYTAPGIGAVMDKIPIPTGVKRYMRLVTSVATVGTYRAFLSAS